MGDTALKFWLTLNLGVGFGVIKSYSQAQDSVWGHKLVAPSVSSWIQRTACLSQVVGLSFLVEGSFRRLKMVRRQEQIDEKVAVLRLINEQKALLLGAFDHSKGITKTSKNKSWEKIFWLKATMEPVRYTLTHPPPTRKRKSENFRASRRFCKFYFV